MARAPEVVKRLANEKEEMFMSLQQNRRAVPQPGVVKLLETLRKHEV
jgi:hypothetical protein